jgi:hypothetical protein
VKTTPFRTAHLAGFPLTIHLYTENWKPEDVQFALLFGGMMGTLAGLLTAWYLYIRMRPGKEILTAIKQISFMWCTNPWLMPVNYGCAVSKC